MDFFKNISNDSEQAWAEKFNNYQEYLRANEKSYPKEAFEFANADWHYNNIDPRCPHDSWLESFQIFEEAKVDDVATRQIRIRTVLLGAYHNGQIGIEYEGVRGYSLN